LNGKQAKHSRAAAHAEAQRRGLWKQGEASVFAKWWLRLFSRISPKLRRRYIDAIGRWYKRTLKDFARQAYAFRPGTHAREIAEKEARRFERARRIARRKLHEEMALRRRSAVQERG
jgi:hypothetical protein